MAIKKKPVIMKTVKEEKPDVAPKGLTMEEQETIIQWNRGKDERVNIYTADQSLIRKLDKFCEDSPKVWQLRRTDMRGNVVLSKEYWGSSKALVTIREKRTQREMSDEQKLAASERMKNMRAKKQGGVKS